MPPITPIYGFGPGRWEGYESLSGGAALGMVHRQYVPPAMEPGVVVEMAHLIPQPQTVVPRGAGPFTGLGVERYHTMHPSVEPRVVQRMARYLDTPMMAGTDEKPTLRDAFLGIAISGVAVIVGVSAVFWIGRELAR